jgi:tripeptide aminopeptidase
MSQIWKNFLRLTAIDSPSRGERTFCDTLKASLTTLGLDVFEDSVGEQIHGNCGNLYAVLPGSLPLPPLLFSAHMDTVEPSANKKAILCEDGKIVSDGNTVLGADDAAGIVILLEAITRLKESGKAHRPLEFLFPVAEELYGLGSAYADFSRIRAREAYVLDLSGTIGTAANAAPTILPFQIEITGKAAHAGFAPEQGVHAIAAAAKAVARLPLGMPQPGVTVNIGTIGGGETDNIIPARCRVTGEIRSLSHEAVMAQWASVKTIFEQEAACMGAHVDAQAHAACVAYKTDQDSETVRRYVRACAQIGLDAQIQSTLGGSDQNNFAQHGIQGLVVACSMHDVHSTREYAYLHEMEIGTALVLALILDPA